MKKTILILALVFMFCVSFTKIVSAVMAAPSPICEITANVTKIEKTTDTHWYNVTLDIIKISTDQQEGAVSCDNSYIDSVKGYDGRTLLFSGEYNQTPIFEDQKIQAKIHFGGDERLAGYFISNISILEGSVNPKVGSNYWYYVAPAGLGLLVGVLFIILKKKK